MRINALLSTRFNRDIEIADGAGVIHRRHAEDFCQALGLPPILKYERDAVDPHRRFSAAAVDVIAVQATVPALVRRDFLAQTVFNLLVGNSDNHGKNTSLLIRGRTVLPAPLYDVVPVFMDRRATHEFAFRHGDACFAEDFDVDALRGLAQEFDVHSNQIKQWRDPLFEGATGVFGETRNAEPEPTIDVKTLHTKIGELTLENDFLSGALGKAGLLPSAKR